MLLENHAEIIGTVAYAPGTIRYRAAYDVCFPGDAFYGDETNSNRMLNQCCPPRESEYPATENSNMATMVAALALYLSERYAVISVTVFEVQ